MEKYISSGQRAWRTLKEFSLFKKKKIKMFSFKQKADILNQVAAIKMVILTYFWCLVVEIARVIFVLLCIARGNQFILNPCTYLGLYTSGISKLG